MKQFMFIHFGFEQPTPEIMAESIDEAEKFANDCPYIASIRVYEIRSML